MLQTSIVSSRGMVSDLLFERLVGRVQKDEGVDKEMAERIVNSTLRFLDMCAKNPEKRFSPSPLVDAGWHVFILYTQDYAEFCKKTAGRFIHHEPNDNPNIQMNTGGACATVVFMKENNIIFDPGVWEHASANDCTVDCDNGSGPCNTSKCTCS